MLFLIPESWMPGQNPGRGEPLRSTKQLLPVADLDFTAAARPVGWARQFESPHLLNRRAGRPGESCGGMFELRPAMKAYKLPPASRGRGTVPPRRSGWTMRAPAAILVPRRREHTVSSAGRSEVPGRICCAALAL